MPSQSDRSKILGDAVVEATRILNENIARAAEYGLKVEITEHSRHYASNPFPSPVFMPRVYEPIA